MIRGAENGKSVIVKDYKQEDIENLLQLYFNETI